MTRLNRTTASAPRRPVTIAQFGSGNFLRAFVDWMVQRTNAAGLADNGVAVLYATHREDRHDPLVEQDGLYQVLLEGVRDGEQVRELELVDAVQEIIDPWAAPERVRALAISPELRLVVSNTTEAGIVDREDDDLSVRPAASFPGQVAQLLHDRYESLGGSEAPGLHVLCCELIEDNADTLRSIVLRHAARAGWDEGFRTWLEREVSFHNSLVDRIVSGYPKDDAAWAEARSGLEDRALVKGELFSLWAIDGDPALAQVLPVDALDLGARLVTAAELTAFRTRKVRILNGAHTALAQLGPALGYETVDQAFGDPDLRTFIAAMVSEEVLPTLAGDPAEVRALADSILERFDNTSLHHRLADIGLNSVSKWATRNLPVVVDRWAAGQTADREILALAALLVRYASPAGEVPAPRDSAEALEALAAVDPTDAAALVPVLDRLGLAAGVDAVRLAREAARWAGVLQEAGARACVSREVPIRTTINQE